MVLGWPTELLFGIYHIEITGIRLNRVVNINANHILRIVRGRAGAEMAAKRLRLGESTERRCFAGSEITQDLTHGSVQFQTLVLSFI
jgi:hypothetical protein